MGRSGKTATSKFDGQIESRPISAAKETGLRAAFLRRPVPFFYGAVFLAIAILGAQYALPVAGLSDTGTDRCMGGSMAVGQIQDARR